MSADTYLSPEHGWTCFHCGETFHVAAQARMHFGADPDAEPACTMRAGAVPRFPRTEWPLMYRLRELEAEVAKLRSENEQLDYEAGDGRAMVAELERLFDGARSVHQAWLKLEAMEGRALAAEERAEQVA